MPHLQNVRLRAHKGLKSAELTQLGKINVLCGPNNSGKTTALECLSNPKLFAKGITVGQEQAVEIASKGVSGVGWGISNTHLSNLFQQSVVHSLSAWAIWYADDYQKLIDQIDWGFARGWSSPHGHLHNEFDALFQQTPRTALIPAKRRFETSKAIRSSEKISADGTGILNFLFFAKNQDGSSILRKKFDEIAEAFFEISAGYEFEVFLQALNPNISPPPTNVELLFRRKGSSWIKSEDCGVGLQELLIMLYYALASDDEVILVEEPENHLHPEIQRRLIRFLREKTSKQFFLSTHSSVFLNPQYADRVFVCRMTDSVHIDNATSHATLLAELGYSIADNLVSDIIVLCEGPKDKPVIEEFIQKFGTSDRFSIKIWPLGGDIMDQLDLTVFQETHRLIALIDGDPKSSVVRKRFLKKCEELRVPVTQLKRYALENYFSVPAIASVMKGQMPSEVVEIKPDTPIADQLGFEVKNVGGKIAKLMTLDDIRGTDFEEFLQRVDAMVSKPGSAGQN